jgi:hypothetical protein
MLRAGEGSGGVIFAGREHSAPVSPSASSRRVHRTLAALLIQHLALPSAKRAFADRQKVNSLK